MSTGMTIAFFASSLTSAYWNGAATYYRGIVRALAGRGHRITFYEPDAFERRQHRDLADAPWAEVVGYPSTAEAVAEMIERARGADLVVKASGAGAHDALLDALVLELRTPRTQVVFWEVDTPVTLERIRHAPADPFRALIPRYDLIFTHGGGAPVVAAYTELGARACVPIYNALDPDAHHRVAPDPRFAGALGFLGNRLPDRERRVDDLLLRAARQLPEERIVLGGAGWAGKAIPDNVSYVGHVFTADHNAFHSTPLAVLSVGRDATPGFSPATRVLEAAGAGACVISDASLGIADVLAPGREVLIARDGDEVARHVRTLTPAIARAIGERAQARMLREHTYAHRAIEIEAALGERRADVPSARRRGLRITVLGLSITSSWGNGHATTYRRLLGALAERGHDVTFLEHDVPWYAAHRDLSAAAYARVALYTGLDDLATRFTAEVRDADLVIVGSYVRDGIAIGDWVQGTARGHTAFYDLDTPVTLAALADGACAYLAKHQIPRYGLYLSFTGGPTLAHLERAFGAQHARALYGSIDPETYRQDVRPARWDLGFLGTHSPDHQDGLVRLLVEPARAEPDRRFIVAAAQYASGLPWAPNIERVDDVAPHHHARFYNELAFALTLTRDTMRSAGWSPSARLFEAAACGVPIISDRWDGLAALFEPDDEVLIADTTDDVLRYLRDLGEGARRAIGARASARVRAGHTAAHRAAELERCVAELA